MKKPPPIDKRLWRNPICFIAFGFGSGASPIAPGTMGTLVALPIYWLLMTYCQSYYLLITLLASIIGCWICDVAVKATGVDDHPGIVWDEIVGYLWTMWLIPFGWFWMVLGFVLFRLFDILKPWPIGWIDRQLKGGIGVVVDDIIAGVYAWLILQMVLWWLSHPQY